MNLLEKTILINNLQKMNFYTLTKLKIRNNQFF